MTTSDRPASRAFRLYNFWVGQPPGRGVTMDEMMEVADVSDPQPVRIALVQLRKGRVPDPDRRGWKLRPLPVNYNPGDRLYYNVAQITDENVGDQIPEGIWNLQLTQLMTRALTFETAFGEDGFERSVHDLLSEQGTRRALEQIPIQKIWQAKDAIEAISRARWMIESGTRLGVLPQGPEQLEESEET